MLLKVRRALYHFMPPTSKTLLRSSRLLISEKFSIFHVNFPYRSGGCRPVTAAAPGGGRELSLRDEFNLALKPVERR